MTHVNLPRFVPGTAALAAVFLFGCGGGGDAGDGNVAPSAASSTSTSSGTGAATPGGTASAMDLSRLTSPVSDAPVGQQTERKRNAMPAEQRNPPRH